MCGGCRRRQRCPDGRREGRHRRRPGLRGRARRRGPGGRRGGRGPGGHRGRGLLRGRGLVPGVHLLRRRRRHGGARRRRGRVGGGAGGRGGPRRAGRVALGLAVDAPRRRLLVVYADRPPRFGYAALGAYELGSWRRLFLTRLDAAGESTFADDVATDEDGNAYVTDTRDNKIWKVSPDGAPLGVIKNATFVQRTGPLNNFVGLNGVVHHPNGYLLVVHTSGGDLFKVDPETGSVRVVAVRGSLRQGDGLELLSPTRLAVAGMPSRLVESSDDWETASVTGRYVGPIHRIGSSATVKDGAVYVNHIVGFGLGRKKTHVIARAVFSPLAAAS